MKYQELMKETIRPVTIKVYTEGGIVTSVEGLPPGVIIDVVDLDEEDQREEDTGAIFRSDKIADLEIRKVSDNPGLEQGYAIRGFITSPLIPGLPMIVLRYSRNGVDNPGFFSTSVITAVEKVKDGKWKVTTVNSEYIVTELK